MTERKMPPDATGAEKRWAKYLDAVCAGLAARCKGVDTSPAYWFEYDCDDYCAEHKPEIWEGGTSNDESDYQKRCCKCGMILECCLTDHGVTEEIGCAIDDDVMDSPIWPEEAYTLLQIIQCGVPRFTERCGEHVYCGDRKPAVRRIAKRLKIPARKAVR